MEDKLSAYLRKSREWKRRPTNVSGLFLLKLPSSRSRQASIAIEINPVDATGVATNNRGTVIRSASELHQFNNILADQKLIELIRRENPKQKEESITTGSYVFEIQACDSLNLKHRFQLHPISHENLLSLLVMLLFLQGR
jgi:hypothetical protein